MATIVNIEADESGDLYVPIPPDMLESLGWNEKTILDIFVNESKVEIRKKTDWSMSEAQDNLEIIMDDVEQNKTIHHILHEGKVFVLAPYSEELEKLL